MLIKNSLMVIKVSVLLLSILTVTLAIKLHYSNNEVKTLSRNLALDQKVYTNEINEILIRYDSVLIKNQRLFDEIELLENHKNSINSSEFDYNSSIKKLKGNISILKKGNLSKENQLATLHNILKLRQIDLENNKEEIGNLNLKISKLQGEIRNSSSEIEVKKLRAINVVASGSRIVSDKVLETKKFKNTEKIKVCFTLEENTLIEKGAKDIFIQVINPKSNIVSKNPSMIEIKNKTLLFSTKTVVNYTKENLDVCVLVDATKNTLLKGEYIVNIFHGANLIGNTNLTLL